MSKHKWLAPVAFALLAALTVFVVSRQSASFSAEGFLDYVAAVKPWGLIAAVGCMLAFILFEGLGLLMICRALGYRRGVRRGVLYSAADIYFSAITPSASGGQPASALMMIRDGIPAAVTTVALLMNLVLYTLSIFVIVLLGLPFSPHAYSDFGVPSHMLIITGIILQVLLLGGIMLLILHEKVFLRIFDFFLHLGQRLRLVKNAESRRSKLLEIEKDYRASAGVLHRHIPALLAAFGYNLLQRLAIVMVPVLLYVASGHPARDMGRVFALQSWVVMGSNSIPMPGAVGVADYLFLDGYGTLMPDPVNLELLSRTISFYSCVLVCAAVLLFSLALRKCLRK